MLTLLCIPQYEYLKSIKFLEYDNQDKNYFKKCIF